MDSHGDIYVGEVTHTFGVIPGLERPGNLRNALEQALEADRPVLVDVVTDIEAFPQAPWS